MGADMPTTPKRGRPKPIAVGEVRIRAIRGPRNDGRWYWRAEYHAERANVWTGWGTPKEATRAVTEHVAEHGYAAAPDERRVHLAVLDDMMRAWFAHLEDNHPELEPATFRTYRGCVRRLRAVAATVAISRLPTGAADEVRAALIRRYAPATVQTTTVAFNSAWAWARTQALVPDVALTMAGVKLPVVALWTPTDEQITQALDRITDWRWRIVAGVLIVTGARPVDLARATRLEEGGIVLDGKTGQRWVPLPPSLYTALASWRLAHGEETVTPWTEGYLRAGFWRRITTAAAAAGLPRINARAIRRACSDRLLRARTELAAYASWMGHSPAVALKNYRRATKDDLREAAEDLVKPKANRRRAQVVVGPWGDDEG